MIWIWNLNRVLCRERTLGHLSLLGNANNHSIACHGIGRPKLEHGIIVKLCLDHFYLFAKCASCTSYAPNQPTPEKNP